MRTQKNILPLTKSELMYMEIIWNNPTGVNSEELYNFDTSFVRSRTGNLLYKIVQKGVAKYEKNGRHYTYFPTISKEEYEKLIAKNEVEKLIPTDISMVQMIAAFCGKTNITKAQYSKISDLLEQLEQDLDNESN